MTKHHISAAPAPEGVAVERACVVFQEAIDDFEAEVADVMAEGSERADLWDREITVNIDALKTVMSAALATREEAPALENPDEPSASENARDWPSEEAPAEAGALVSQIDALLAIPEANLSSRIPYLARELLERSAKHLRAQPPAREDAQPVAWRWKTPIQHVGDGTRWGWTFASHPSTPPASINPEPLYTHPAPDALRAAVEAFDVITDLSVNLRQGGPDSSDLNDLSDALNTAVDVAHEALAALQAEQGAK